MPPRIHFLDGVQRGQSVALPEFFVWGGPCFLLEEGVRIRHVIDSNAGDRWVARQTVKQSLFFFSVLSFRGLLIVSLLDYRFGVLPVGEVGLALDLISMGSVEEHEVVSVILELLRRGLLWSGQ